MIRRQARQRRDYLYRRALTLRDAEIAERRAQLKASLASGKPLDPNVANDRQLRRDFKYDESQPDARKAADDDDDDVDDEYAALSGVQEARVVVTTSRSPSTRLGAFAKEIRLLLPTAIRLNRGGIVLGQLISSARAAGMTDVCLLHEHRGVPSALTISHLPHGPTASFSLHNVALRHDLPNAVRGSVSEAYPHLIFDGFTTPLGRRVVSILKHLWPARDRVTAQTPTDRLGNRVVTFRNEDDSIELRHHVWVRSGAQSVELAEVGPRMTLRLFEVRAGTLDARDTDVEWHLNQYTRTSQKKNYL